MNYAWLSVSRTKIMSSKAFGSSPENQESRIREAIRADPSNNAYRLQLSKLLLQRGAPHQAERVLREALLVDPGDEDAASSLTGFAWVGGELGFPDQGRSPTVESLVQNKGTFSGETTTPQGKVEELSSSGPSETARFLCDVASILSGGSYKQLGNLASDFQMSDDLRVVAGDLCKNLDGIDRSKAAFLCQLADIFTEGGGIDDVEKHCREVFAAGPESELIRDKIVDLLYLCIHRGARGGASASVIAESRSPSREPPPDELRNRASLADWITEGRSWWSPAGWGPIGQVNEFEFLSRHELRWADNKLGLFGRTPGNDWLNELLARAEQIEALLSYEPEWPAILKTDRLTVIIWADEHWVRGWVGVDGSGVVASVGLGDWELRYREDSVDAEFAAGVVLGWFLDCSMRLPESDHPHYKPRELRLLSDQPDTKTSKISPQWIIGTRPEFLDHVRSVRAERSRLPLAHRVRGHIRKLSDSVPSEEARGRAPSYIRRIMLPNQTFVQGYQRSGEEKLVTLKTHLSYASNLSDALGSCELLSS